MRWVWLLWRRETAGGSGSEPTAPSASGGETGAPCSASAGAPHEPGRKGGGEGGKMSS